MKIGTRKSALAVRQGEMVCDALFEHYSDLDISLATFTTSGDKFVDRPLSEIGGKGLFTKELEEALLRNEIDIAVHSIKDMATVLPDGLVIAAILEREDPRDMFVGNYASLDELPKGSRFGTSSLRRAAQIKILRSDLEIVPFRGNLQTRLEKLKKGEVAATMLACAGLNRLALDVPGFILPVEKFLPAVAQGAIGIQCRAEDKTIIEMLSIVNHEPTHTAIRCERSFLKVLDGSCRTPIAGYAQIKGNTIHLSGLIAKPDGSGCHERKSSGSVEQPEETGIMLGQLLLAEAGPDFISK